VLGGLGEAEARVEHQPPGVDAAALRGLGPAPQLGADLRDHVVVHRPDCMSRLCPRQCMAV
jgi:hypothetical protein